MKPICCLLITILLLQPKLSPAPRLKISCVSITSSGRLASCPAGNVVTGCACGHACGSWDIQRETTCHGQCSVTDWTTARCCRLIQEGSG